jgi:hypothetical protein
VAAPVAALAQAYPSKPVTIIVPVAAGRPVGHRRAAHGQGPGRRVEADVHHRQSRRSGRQHRDVDGHQGCAGRVHAAHHVERAHRDQPSLYKQMPFDPPKDLAPITNLLRVPLILAVNASVPANNLKELIAYINSQKGKVQYASSGNGTPQHLTASSSSRRRSST